MVLALVWVFAATQPRIPSVFYQRAVLRIDLVSLLMEGGFGHERFNGFKKRRGTDHRHAGPNEVCIVSTFGTADGELRSDN